MKGNQEVIDEFHKYVNMDVPELRSWLETDSSRTTGLTHPGASESVGHESGRKIADILARNPAKDPEKYTDEDLKHMRKVVAYCKRHIAGEQGAMLNEESRSHRSLKNWGHDAVKAAEEE